jgi:hypothetical protein
MTSIDDCDVHVLDQGSMVIFVPLSEAAQNWFKENVSSESWQWVNGGLCVDHRYARDLIEGLVSAGMELEGMEPKP